MVVDRLLRDGVLRETPRGASAVRAFAAEGVPPVRSVVNVDRSRVPEPHTPFAGPDDVLAPNTRYDVPGRGHRDVVCTDPLDALRYVQFRSGVKQRQRYLYGRLLVPFSRSLAHPGFVITPNEGVGAMLTVVAPDGRGSGRRLDFKLAGRATEATFYLNASFEDILDSIHTPSGESLFGDVRQVQPTGVEHARP